MITKEQLNIITNDLKEKIWLNEDLYDSLIGRNKGGD